MYVRYIVSRLYALEHDALLLDNVSFVPGIISTLKGLCYRYYKHVLNDAAFKPHLLLHFHTSRSLKQNRH